MFPLGTGMSGLETGMTRLGGETLGFKIGMMRLEIGTFRFRDGRL
jgi:hypothetical protein